MKICPNRITLKGILSQTSLYHQQLLWLKNFVYGHYFLGINQSMNLHERPHHILCIDHPQNLLEVYKLGIQFCYLQYILVVHTFTLREYVRMNLDWFQSTKQNQKDSDLFIIPIKLLWVRVMPVGDTLTIQGFYW